MELHLVKIWTPLNFPKRLIPLLWNAVILFTSHQILPGQDANYRRLERNLLLLGPEQGIYLKIAQVIKIILNDKQRLAVILQPLQNSLCCRLPSEYSRNRIAC
jgi:hypothetical protein